MTTTHLNNSRLVLLPQELRFQIYNCLLTTPFELHTPQHLSHPTAQAKSAFSSTTASNVHPALALLYTCHQLASELSPYIRQYGWFRLHSATENVFSTSRTHTLREQLERFVPVLQTARNIELVRTVGTFDARQLIQQQMSIPRMVTNVRSVYEPWPVPEELRPKDQRICLRVLCEGLFPAPNIIIGKEDTTLAVPIPGPEWASSFSSEPAFYWSATDIVLAPLLARFFTVFRTGMTGLKLGLPQTDIWFAGEIPSILQVERGGDRATVSFRHANGLEGRVLQHRQYGMFVQTAKRAVGDAGVV